jgi:hypothetical protein
MGTQQNLNFLKKTRLNAASEGVTLVRKMGVKICIEKERTEVSLFL